MNDKKGQGCDGMPVKLLTKIGYQHAFQFFSQWTNKRLVGQMNNYWSTAKVVFLSKTKSEIVNSHSDYRALSV